MPVRRIRLACTVVAALAGAARDAPADRTSDAPERTAEALPENAVRRDDLDVQVVRVYLIRKG